MCIDALCVKSLFTHYINNVFISTLILNAEIEQFSSFIEHLFKSLYKERNIAYTAIFKNSIRIEFIFRCNFKNIICVINLGSVIIISVIVSI